MATYSVNVNGLLEAGGELASVTDGLETSLGELDSAVRQFLGANDGLASQEFHQAQTEWNAGLQQMRQSLVRAQQALTSSVESYDLADKRSANRFTSGL